MKKDDLPIVKSDFLNFPAHRHDVLGQNAILQRPCPYPSLSVTPQSEYTVLTRSELLPDAVAAL